MREEGAFDRAVVGPTLFAECSSFFCRHKHEIFKGPCAYSLRGFEISKGSMLMNKQCTAMLHDTHATEYCESY